MKIKIDYPEFKRRLIAEDAACQHQPEESIRRMYDDNHRLAFSNDGEAAPSSIGSANTSVALLPKLRFFLRVLGALVICLGLLTFSIAFMSLYTDSHEGWLWILAILFIALGARLLFMLRKNRGTVPPTT